MSKPTERGKYSEWITLDWYDGPLLEVALVTFDDGTRLAEMKCLGGWVGEEYRTGKDDKRHYVNHMRVDRETLVAMLDMIDGKPVTDFFNHEVSS